MSKPLFAASIMIALSSCAGAPETATETESSSAYLAEPLITEIFTADPSAHVWDDGRIYIYPSHDIETNVGSNEDGGQFDMKDYRVISMDAVGAAPVLHDVALHVDDVPWAFRQMWAPDAAYRDGTYYLYFPAKDKDDIFRIGVASSDTPTGPFTPEPEPIAGTYSIDPAVFEDGGEYYLYLGGIWGGQLQKWSDGTFDPDGSETDLGDPTLPALAPKIARLSEDMKTLAEPLQDIQILDEDGSPILAGDLDRRFFEGAWVFKRDGQYYFTYSTGDTHYLVYATGTSPYGPFTYQGRILEPVEGWTSHHSIFEHQGRWYLAYHDTQLSGQTHLRNVKITELFFDEDGRIQTLTP